jgi:hypothetical protein
MKSEPPKRAFLLKHDKLLAPPIRRQQEDPSLQRKTKALLLLKERKTIS